MFKNNFINNYFSIPLPSIGISFGNELRRLLAATDCCCHCAAISSHITTLITNRRHCGCLGMAAILITSNSCGILGRILVAGVSWRLGAAYAPI